MIELKVEPVEVLKRIAHNVATRTEDAFYYVYPKQMVIANKVEDINVSYCVTNEIETITVQNLGGAIVANKGDVGIAIFKKEGFEVGKNMLLKVKEILSEYVPNLEIQNNDLIAEGKYKLASFASTDIGDRVVYTAIHISYNPDVDVIKAICKKPMIKVPKGLIDYSISPNSILNKYKEKL